MDIAIEGSARGKENKELDFWTEKKKGPGLQVIKEND